MFVCLSYISPNWIISKNGFYSKECNVWYMNQSENFRIFVYIKLWPFPVLLSTDIVVSVNRCVLISLLRRWCQLKIRRKHLESHFVQWAETEIWVGCWPDGSTEKNYENFSKKYSIVSYSTRDTSLYNSYIL